MENRNNKPTVSDSENTSVFEEIVCAIGVISFVAMGLSFFGAIFFCLCDLIQAGFISVIVLLVSTMLFFISLAIVPGDDAEPEPKNSEVEVVKTPAHTHCKSCGAPVPMEGDRCEYCRSTFAVYKRIV